MNNLFYLSRPLNLRPPTNFEDSINLIRIDTKIRKNCSNLLITNALFGKQNILLNLYFLVYFNDFNLAIFILHGIIK